MSIFNICILFLILFPSSLRAQSLRPLAPSVETPFTEASDPELREVLSISTPPIDLEGGKLSFDVVIQNPNDRDIRCVDTQFLASMAVFGERCETDPYKAYVDINSGKGPLDIPGNQEFAVKLIGNDVREDRSRKLGKDLEFCGREPTALRCGYNCSNGRKFDEQWSDPILGGSKKYRCDEAGEIRRTSDPVECANGYASDPINDRCLKMCDAQHRPGDSWSEEVSYGRVEYICLSDGSISASPRCNAGYQPNGSVCIPLKCGGTDHGQRLEKYKIDHGVVTERCEFGNWVDPKASCNEGYTSSALQCVESGCEGNPPGAIRVDRGCPAESRFGRRETYYICSFGKWKYQRTDGQCSNRPRGGIVP